MKPFPRDFYAQNACVVARALLGARLVRLVDGVRVSGMIVETEAYSGPDDLASHGRGGKTPRNLPMWETPGQAYVYLCYGMYWLLNAVCQPEEEAAAVLIRGIQPMEGESVIAANRPDVAPRNWTNGPGRLTRGLGVTGSDNRTDLTRTDSGLWIGPGEPVEDAVISTGPRIGMGKSVYEPWFSMPWRYWITGNKYVSK
jgi:DNA-3-methyladenine glycosylase